MATEQLKVGDVVRLKSGGPKMTITQLLTQKGQPTCVCQWFADGTNKNEAAAFPAEALAIV
jgi:uncharacterized protein YodC (DUF2158 family)